MSNNGSHSTESLVDKAAGGFMWSFMGAGGQAVVNALVVVLLARLLTPEDFGLVGAAIVVVNLTQMFMHFGVGPAIVQRQHLTRDHIRVGFTLSLGFGVIFALIVYSAAPILADLYRMPDLVPIVRVLAIAFPISAVASIGRSLLQRALHFRTLAIIELISFAFGYGAVSITLALFNQGPWALILGQIGQTTLATILVLSASRGSVGLSFKLQEAKHLLGYGMGLTLARIFNYLATQADNFIVGRYLGAEMLGLYTRAYQLLMLPTNLIGSVLDKVLFPVMASAQSDGDRLSKAFGTSIGVVILVTLPLSVGLGLAAPQVVLTVLGDQWSSAITPFRILILFLVWRTAYKISDSLARAVGAVYRRIWRQLVYFLAVVVGALIGQHVAGLSGVAWGVGAAVLINFLLTLQLSVSLLGTSWKPILGILARHTIVASAVGIAVFCGLELASQFLKANWFELLGAGMFGVTAFVGMWKLFPQLFGSEGRFLQSYVAKRMNRIPS